MRVFLDTVGLLAVWDKSDQWHAAAEDCLGKLLASRADLVTTTYVLLECGNAAARRPYRLAVSQLRERMEESGRLIAPTREDWENAWRVYASGGKDQAGMVDLVSFAVMRRLGISQAFTNDRHFQQAGFEILF